MRQLRLLLALPLLCVPLAALAAPTQAQLKDSLASLAQSKAEEARLKAALQKTQSALEDLRKQATSNAAATRDAERNATAAEARLADTIQNLDKAQADFELKRDAYSHTLRHLLSLQRLPATAFFGPQADVDAMLKTASVLEIVHKALAERAEALHQSITKLSALKTRLENDRSYSALRQKRLAEQYSKLSTDLEARQKLQAQLQHDHAEAEARTRKFADESKNLYELINKLAAENIKKAQPAETAKGSWKAPVSGNVLHRYGETKASGDSYRGIVFAARPGGSVIAPSSGEVVFTGPFRDYGPMVLLRHKSGYISLLAGLADIRVSLGQSVHEGEPVGRMGTGGTPSLYVELRKDGKPIDPAAWFANLGNHLASQR